MKTRIYIGTPSGPVQVERIWREEGIAESMVCLKRTTEKLPIGAGYDDFVKRPSGIIEREFGPFEAGAFRLDLSNSINQGKSWQLAVFAAHALAHEGLLAGPDDPFERAIWLTGQVDNDLKLGGVTQVPEKTPAFETATDEWGIAQVNWHAAPFPRSDPQSAEAQNVTLRASTEDERARGLKIHIAQTNWLPD